MTKAYSEMVSMAEDYLKQEAAFCRKELEDFYNCNKPNGSYERENLRRLLEAARDQFAKEYSLARTEI